MDLPQSFFTWESLGTLSGAAGVTFVVANTVRHAFGIDPRLLSLLISQLVAFFGVYISKSVSTDYVLGIFNGCLIYCTATGIAEISSGPDSKKNIQPNERRLRGKRSTSSKSSNPKGRFFASWWH